MSTSDRDRLFGHMVFFTLKDSSPEAQARLVQDCQHYLSDHPGTLHFSSGTLADTMRPVNDRTFHVALHLVFANRAAHDAYQDAERHLEFVRQNKDNWVQVRVFDSYLC
jgi:hypothetical protein